MEAAWMSIHRWMGKEAVVYTCNGILLGHKKECMSQFWWGGWTWALLYRVKYTRKEQKISRTNTHTWNLERWCSWHCLQGSDGDTQTRLTDMRGRGGRESRESNMETDITAGKADSQWVCCMTQGTLWPPRGVAWGGRREAESGKGARVHLWLIHTDVRQKPTPHCKAIVLRFKINKIFKTSSKNLPD